MPFPFFRKHARFPRRRRLNCRSPSSTRFFLTRLHEFPRLHSKEKGFPWKRFLFNFVPPFNKEKNSFRISLEERTSPTNVEKWVKEEARLHFYNLSRPISWRSAPVIRAVTKLLQLFHATKRKREEASRNFASISNFVLLSFQLLPSSILRGRGEGARNNNRWVNRARSEAKQ